ncbi:TetR/AcrR family transcriptional regulator [Actinomadura sp. DC4]|uniref:TetR/AcrR family transcriptional regulator n=1 Tax=Actinomadura sp. DC4 TaxID=3055069 RepID=UPI0025B161CF|nr:TetR/AcrR family transcriptional regulator [Actinomadura sp. DC4]MDN3357409.1 TetR family transcriptional regulator [Actinomadura sp. DC4]
MAGSRKDVRLRLQRAALELFAERGFERTTAAEIAARADVTERTYFRHFPDKREVLFDGEAAMRKSLVDAVANAPAGLTPLPLLLEAFLSVVPRFEADRELKVRRHRVIEAAPELRERELTKFAHLTDAITTALEHRDVAPGLASLAATCGIAVLTRVRHEWLAGDTRDYPTLLTDAFADLTTLFDRDAPKIGTPL